MFARRQTPVSTRRQTPVCTGIQTPGADEKTEIKRFMAASQGVTSIWSRSQAPPSSRSQTPEAIVGQRLSAQKPAEDITWESNSNTSTESRSINFLSHCDSHVDRVFQHCVETPFGGVNFLLFSSLKNFCFFVVIFFAAIH